MKINKLLLAIAGLFLCSALPALGQGQFSGGGTAGATISGSLTTGNCVSAASSTSIQDAGAPCGSGALPSGTQGCWLVNNSGSTTYSTDCPTIDAVKFASTGGLSADAAGSIQNAIVACPATGCVIDARGFGSGIVFGSDPYSVIGATDESFTTTKNVTILLPAGTITVNAVIGMPQQARLIGEGPNSTTLLVGGSFPVAASSNCTASTGQCYPVICLGATANGGGNNDNQTFYFQSAHKVSCETAPSATTFTNYPRVEVENLRIDLNNTANLWGVVNAAAQEKSWYKNGQIAHIPNGGGGLKCANVGSHNTGVGGQTGDQCQNSSYSDLEILYNDTCQSADTLWGAYIANGPKVTLDHVTFNSNSPCTPPATSTIVAVEAGGNSVHLSDIHIERYGVGVQTGDVRAGLNEIFENINGTSNVGTLFAVSNSNHTTGHASLFGQGSNNLVVDSQSSVTVGVATSPSISTYTLGVSGDTNNNIFNGVGIFENAATVNGTLTGNTNIVVGSANNGGFISQENTCSGAPATTGQDILCGNSTAHWFEISNNNSTYEPVAGLNGTITANAIVTGKNGNELQTPSATSTLNSSGQMALAGNLSIGSGPPTACGTATGCAAFGEASTAGTPTASQDYCRSDSTAHGFKCSLNNGAEFTSLMNFSTVTNALITGMSEDKLTGAAAASTITETGATFSITRAGVATANLTAPWVFQNTNSTNNNTSITLGVNSPGTSTGQTTLNVNGTTTQGNLLEAGTGGTWASGVLSGQTKVFQVSPTGQTTLGAGPTCAGSPTSGAGCLTEGTPPTAVAGVDDIHADSTQKALEVNNNNTGEMPVSRVTCINVTPVTVNANVTTDQNLMTCTLAANLLNVIGRTLHVHSAGIYSTAATSTAQLTPEAKLCTVSGCGSGTVIDLIDITTVALGSVTVTNNNWNLDFYATTQTAGATAAFESHGQFVVDLGALTTAADSTFADTNTGTIGTIDSTAQLFLQISWAFSAASASNSVSQRQGVVEVLN